MSIQYTVLGSEPTTFGTKISSHNHKTRAPAPGQTLTVREYFSSILNLQKYIASGIDYNNNSFII